MTRFTVVTSDDKLWRITAENEQCAKDEASWRSGGYDAIWVTVSKVAA
jgi:hypothetical protein